MIQETDIPCAECNDELEERTVHTDELAIQTAYRGPVSVAECPNCHNRYFPERSLRQLLEESGEQRTLTNVMTRECDE